MEEINEELTEPIYPRNKAPYTIISFFVHFMVFLIFDVIGGFFGFITLIIAGIFFYVYFKFKGIKVVKFDKNFIRSNRKKVIGLGAELIPVVSLIPYFTMLFWNIHKEEKQVYMQAVEEYNIKKQEYDEAIARQEEENLL